LSEFSEATYGREQHSDEPAVIGWGGDDEDGMGML
jgi:hypothetical protein